jgi:hypothetical protein
MKMKAPVNNHNDSSPLEDIVGAKLPELKKLPYFRHAMNVLSAIPLMICASLIFLGVSLFSTHQDVDLPLYLE